MAQTAISISAAAVMITAAVLAAPLSAIAGGAEDPSSAAGAMGLPGCQTSCGNVGVPYPFGIGAGCYHSPGFNLTCDHSSHPPRLLLGEEDNTFRVVEITLWSSTVRVVRTGAIINATSHGHNVTSEARFRVPGGKESPYQLSGGNELVLTGCNAVAVLHDVRNNVISGCSSICESTGRSAGTRVRDPASGDKYCSGSGCCQAPIYNDHVTDMGLQFRWLNGYDHQRDMSTLPSYVFIAEEGWFDDQPSPSPSLSVADELLYHNPPSRAALEVPVVLYWTVRHSEANHGSPCKSKHSFDFFDTCTCWFGHDGNPYVPDGCIDVDECEQPEEYGCFGECINLPGTFDCRCPPGTHGNHTVPGGCVKSVTGRKHVIFPYLRHEDKLISQ